MLRPAWLLFFSVLLLEGTGQYNWKQERDAEGIKVYSSELKDVNFKAVKVECTLSGSYAKLVAILCDIADNSKWIYNSKVSYLVKQITPLDFIYYTETHFPWPMSNRDAVIHLRIRADSLPKFITISGTSEPDLVPELSGKVRVIHYAANWKVTMPTPETIHIVYTLEADPGGSIPSWLSNIFIDKGPYETFKKLSEMLVK